MTYFTDLQIKRRSIYALGKDLELSNQELIETIQGAVLNTPTAVSYTHLDVYKRQHLAYENEWFYLTVRLK